MLLSELKSNLLEIKSVNFKLPGGNYIPAHFHLTEIGMINKSFIDCGGIIRNEKKISLQLLHANDTHHRLSPEKFLNIIDLSEKVIHAGDHEVEAEYQLATIGRYALDFDGVDFLLLPLHTACLAKDACGMTEPALQTSEKKETCCTPGGGCC